MRLTARLLLRVTLPILLGYGGPLALALLFVVSQLSAVVDFAALASELQAQPWWIRSAARGLCLIAATSGALPAVRALETSVGPWLRTLPLTDRQVGTLWMGLAGLAALPLGIGAALDGPASAASVVLGAGATALIVRARRWRGVPVAILVGSLPAWLCAVAGVAALPWIGGIAKEAPLSTGPAGFAWFRGPLQALWMRDALVLWRTERSPLVTTTLLSTVVMGFVLSQVHRHWEPAVVDASALLGLAIFGSSPAWAASRLAEHSHSSLWDRSIPVDPRQRAVVLVVLVSTPLVPMLCVSIPWLSPVGALRLLAATAVVATWAVWSSARARDRGQRLQGIGSGVAVSVFTSLFAMATA